MVNFDNKTIIYIFMVQYNLTLYIHLFNKINADILLVQKLSYLLKLLSVKLKLYCFLPVFAALFIVSKYQIN